MKNFPLPYFSTSLSFFYNKIKTIGLYVLLFSVLLGFGKEVIAQPSVEWQTVLGGSQFESFSEILQTPDGGYIAMGRSRSSNGDVSNNYGDNDFWVVKLDENGTLIWETNLGGSGNDVPNALTLRPNGGAIIVGFTRSSASVDINGISNGETDGWIVAINEDGVIDWEKNIGGSLNDGFMDIITTSDGGFILLGETTSSDGDMGANNGNIDIFVTKLTGTGAIEWIRNYGGSEDDRGVSIFELPGNLYVIGSTTESSDGNISVHYGERDIWMLYIHSNGTPFIDLTFGGVGPDYLFDLQPTSDGGFIGTGRVRFVDLVGGADSGANKNLVLKVNANESFEWSEIIEGSNGFGGKRVIQTLDGKYLVIDENNKLFQLNEQGMEEWELTFSDSNYASIGVSDVLSINDKLILSGYARTEVFGVSNFDALVMQLGSSVISSPCPNDFPDFTTLGEFNGSKYYISNDISRPTDAQLIAEANNGNLVVINSQAENDFIQQNISEMAYIGLQDFDTEGELTWVNGDVVNYNNINPCNFCESNSNDQDFLIMQPWDGAWSFSNFYNQRKFIIEVECGSGGGGTISTGDTTGCHFLTTFSTNNLFQFEECVEETPDGFFWAGVPSPDPFDFNPIGINVLSKVKILENGTIDFNNDSQFNTPGSFNFLGMSKNLPFAFVINFNGDFAVCLLDWQELWSMSMPGLTSDLYHLLRITEINNELILTGFRINSSGEIVPFVKVMDINSGGIILDINLPNNDPNGLMQPFSRSKKASDGNYYIFGNYSVYKVNSSGVIWISEFINPISSRINFMGETPDGSAIFVGVEDTQSPFLGMVNAADGSTIWQKDVNSILPPGRIANFPFSFTGVASQDGGVTIGINTDSIFVGGNQGFYLANINQNCEVVWEQEYGFFYRDYNLQLASSDGGYVLTQTFSNQIVFLKLNSVGLEEPACGTTNNLLPDLYVEDLQIYQPNQGLIFETSDLILFDFDYTNLGGQDTGAYQVSIYLQDASNVEPDIQIGNLTLDYFGNAIQNLLYELFIPDVSSGEYRLYVVIDDLDEITEIDENNNRANSFFFQIINPNQGNCPDVLSDYTSLGEFGGSKYFLSNETAKPLDAFAQANLVGGNLAAIGSQAENDFIANQLTEMAYIGLTDFYTEGDIEWEDGNPITFTNFDICDFCNDNTPDMDFVVMHSWNGGWSWSNFYNSRKYIVEMPCPMTLTDPLNTTLINILPNEDKYVEEVQKEILLEKIYPNPADDFIFTQIKSTIEETIEIYIYDARGVLVKSQKVNLNNGVNKIQMNVNDLSKGVYSVFVPMADEGGTTLRFVK